MIKGTAPVHGPEEGVSKERDEGVRFLSAVWVILIVLALAVASLRLHRLSELPPRLYYDEGAHGVDALKVLQGEHAPYFVENNGREGLIVYAVALSTALLGSTVLAIRLPTALASAGTVFLVFWLGRLLFGKDEESGIPERWRGLLVGGIGAGMMAVSLGQMVIGRTAFRANFLPLLLSLCFVLLWVGWRQQSWWRIAIAGVCAGLLPYTYIAARFVPILFLLFGLSFLLPYGSCERGQEGRVKNAINPYSSRLYTLIKSELPRAVIFSSVTALVAAPILVYFALHPEDFTFRSSQLSVFQPSSSQGDPLGALLENVWAHILALGYRGDPNLRYNVPGQSLLNPLEAFFFWLGTLISLWRWRSPQNRLLILWLGLMLLPAMLSRDHNVPNTLRMIGATPAIYLLIGVGAWETIRFGPQILFGSLAANSIRKALLMSPPQSSSKTSQINVKDRTRVAIAIGLLVGGLILVQGALSYRTYFVKWATASTEIEQLFWTQWQELTQVVNAQLSPPDIAFLIPSYRWHYSFEYLDTSAAPSHVVYLDAPNLTARLASELSAMERVSAVKIVDWYDDSYFHWSHYETERFQVLLGKYGRYEGSDKHAAFLIHTYTDIDMDRPWTVYEELESLAVHYDRGISLHGFALIQDSEQLSPSQPQFNLGQGRSLWVALQWETAPGLDIDFSISLRLHNAEGGRVFQGDDVLWRSTDHSSTSGWESQEMVDTLHLIEIPAELQPGEYELRLVVYDFETQQPTVELGVWEPEYVLAQIRFMESE